MELFLASQAHPLARSCDCLSLKHMAAWERSGYMEENPLVRKEKIDVVWGGIGWGVCGLCGINQNNLLHLLSTVC